MADVETFEKILLVREKDKNIAKKSYQQSVQIFEEVASELYHLLKNKEEAEEKYQRQINTSGSVTTLSSYHSYIEKLKMNIKKLETSVNQARNDMDQKQSKLTQAHIEVKKFEKMVERKKVNLLEKQKLEESKFMDEITVTQFLNNRDR